RCAGSTVNRVRYVFFFFSSRRRHTRSYGDWSSDVCSSDLERLEAEADMVQWMRTFAVEHAVGNWDAFGCQNEQNMYGYKPLEGRSEERRVGKECRARWGVEHEEKKEGDESTSAIT